MVNAVPTAGVRQSALRGSYPSVRIAYAAAFVVLTPVRHPFQFLVHGALVTALYAASGHSVMSLLKRLEVASAFVAIFTLAAFLGWRGEGDSPPFPRARAAALGQAPARRGGGDRAGFRHGWPRALPRPHRGLGLPRDLGDTLLFLLRYAPTLGRRIAELRMAVEARSFGWRRVAGHRQLSSSLGSLVGTAFLRSFDHRKGGVPGHVGPGLLRRAPPPPGPPQTLGFGVPPCGDLPPLPQLCVSAMRTTVRIRGLRYAYPDGTEALRGVDLTMGEGERVGLIGPNGAERLLCFCT